MVGFIGFMTLFAQNRLNIHLRNTTVQKVAISSIDSLYIGGNDTMLNIRMINQSVIGYPVSSIDSLTFSDTVSSLPVLQTIAIDKITQSSARSGIILVSQGDSSVTVRGICWSTTANPTIADSKYQTPLPSSPQYLYLSSLIGSTTYHVRAYATNSYGISYGEPLSFTTTDYTLPVVETTSVTNDTVQMFTAAAQDDGAAPTTLVNSKALNVANAVSGTEGTLLAYPTGMTPSICVNDILAGDTIGGQVTKARIITFGMNFGAMCRNNGKNMTNANYTLWRNAVYSLVGLTIPNTPMIVVALEKPAVAEGMNVVVYPNPTTSNINISNLNLNSTVKIYNMTGQQVFNGKANSDVMTVDMSKYSNGIYMLQVVSNGKSLKSKIIKK